MLNNSLLCELSQSGGDSFISSAPLPAQMIATAKIGRNVGLGLTGGKATGKAMRKLFKSPSTLAIRIWASGGLN